MEVRDDFHERGSRRIGSSYYCQRDCRQSGLNKLQIDDQKIIIK
jgi:hypothetical protein